MFPSAVRQLFFAQVLQCMFFVSMNLKAIKFKKYAYSVIAFDYFIRCCFALYCANIFYAKVVNIKNKTVRKNQMRLDATESVVHAFA